MFNYYWYAVKDGDPAVHTIMKKHYSYQSYKDGRRFRGKYRARNLIVGPGEKMVLVTSDYRSLFVWRKFVDLSGQVGINCAVFHNESDILSSDLIREAEQLAWKRWPNERLYTYVNPRKIKSTNPGYCFIMAGWKRMEEKTKSKGLIILYKEPVLGCG